MTKCVEKAGSSCVDNNATECSAFELTNIGNCVISGYVEESLRIGGAIINVYKLMGIHEQGDLVDVAKNGDPISSGSAQGHGAELAFNDNACQWHSTHTGVNVTVAGYIGYDFGELKVDGVSRYGADAFIRIQVGRIAVRQSNIEEQRATKARIEQSDDGIIWKGVSIIDLPNDSELHVVDLNEKPPTRYWRMRAVNFNGAATGSFWAVEELQLIDYVSTKLNNIQDDMGFMENRDRDYSSQSILIKAHYDLIDVQSDLSKWGLGTSFSQEFYFTVGFDSCVNNIGRPLVIGDVLEVPSEVQYNPELKPIRKYLEVTDVAWSAEGYTPGWKPTLQRITAQPMLASQETQDIVGDLGGIIDDTGFLDIDGDIYQNVDRQDAKIVASAQEYVPMNGEDNSDIAFISEDDIEAAGILGPNLSRLNKSQTGIYVEDAVPPNGAEYTTGIELPVTIIDGLYHRLTYDRNDIPARLYRYSAAKNRWIYLETDKRSVLNPRKPTLQQFIKDQ